jgi:hypothetical protein
MRLARAASEAGLEAMENTKNGAPGGQARSAGCMIRRLEFSVHAEAVPSQKRNVWWSLEVILGPHRGGLNH